VFMEGKDRQCNVARLVIYCVTLHTLVFGFVCVTVRNILIIE